VAYRSRERGVSSELRLVDRTGRPQEVFAASTDITVELAPDGRRVALARLNESRLDADRFPSSLWLLDLPRQVFSRLTVDLVATDENATWSPDGLELAYASHRAGGLAEVLVQRSSGGAAPRVVAKGPLNLHPIDWAPDGTLLLHAHGTQGGFDNLDLYALRPGSKEAEPLIEGPALQAQGQFSRDGRWIAYTSDESGRQEVYVQSATRGGSRSQVSSNGGAQPRWRGDWREHFYVSSAGDVIAVPMTIEGEMLTPGRPITLFTEPSLKINNSLFFYGGAAGYDVTADGSRFLVNRLTREPGAGPIHIVVNWQR
jgi:Tol biopolymer transport system component